MRYSKSQQRLAYFVNQQQQQLLRSGTIGLEKESLRVNAGGGIAQTPHPRELGSPLTHPYITTDYSEALCEFVTPPCDDLWQALDFLCVTQQHVYKNLQSEILWATSMPCVVAGETSIPVANYGTSNAGQMKTLYRIGLGHRYGRVMQVIAGVHFNYSLNNAFWPVFRDYEKSSLPLRDFINAGYFGLIRNLQRFGWLIPYLFGASPAICKSFIGDVETTLSSFDDSTYYEPYATSLRMGNIGYQNNQSKQTGFKANYDNLDDYIASLAQAISTPCAEYEQIGVQVGKEYRQLNSHILQIENEYYSTIRPKQPLIGNEQPILALRRRGVQYVELRSLDVNAFDPLGINAEQLHFLEAFLIFCLLHDSPVINAEERKEIDSNEMMVAHRGREPGLELMRNGESIGLQQWAGEICDAMVDLCEVLDGDDHDKLYSASLDIQQRAIGDPDKTPSARMLAEMRDTQEGFYHFAQRMSRQHYRYFSGLKPNRDKQQFFAEVADQSRYRQRLLEDSESLPFPQYLQCYFAQS